LRCGFPELVKQPDWQVKNHFSHKRSSSLNSARRQVCLTTRTLKTLLFHVLGNTLDLQNIGKSFCYLYPQIHVNSVLKQLWKQGKENTSSGM
jgi:hypothetical protein